MAARPFQNALKSPGSAVLAISAVVLTVVGVKLIVSAMLGVDDSFVYEPSSMVTNRPI